MSRAARSPGRSSASCSPCRATPRVGAKSSPPTCTPTSRGPARGCAPRTSHRTSRRRSTALTSWTVLAEAEGAARAPTGGRRRRRSGASSDDGVDRPELRLSARRGSALTACRFATVGIAGPTARGARGAKAPAGLDRGVARRRSWRDPRPERDVAPAACGGVPGGARTTATTGGEGDDDATGRASEQVARGGGGGGKADGRCAALLLLTWQRARFFRGGILRLGQSLGGTPARAVSLERTRGKVKQGKESEHFRREARERRFPGFSPRRCVNK